MQNTVHIYKTNWRQQ